MASSDSKLKQITPELRYVSLERQELPDRKKMMGVLEELRNHCDLKKTDGATSHHSHICSVDKKLKEPTERSFEVQKSLENIINAKEKKTEQKGNYVPSNPITEPVEPPSCSNIFFVEAPPTFSAPRVYLNSENLPLRPCRTQCPQCHQLVVTETVTSVSSGTWLMCFLTACIGGVAGCCLIPFCIKRFKSTTHKCPLCRSQIQVTKLL
ncbi:cell death-inducing p53-target protein 1-like [Xyrichtys novacula]|uniref:Cell death-inducing p53-target protein 1-like n=1 Tax=Xyrichtys novacula TaxID=13765 RepID=A0AAV1GQ75_XYRNO|nr:cell death-inducing p53-target protein 1-like [Xyrichtys novacula]